MAGKAELHGSKPVFQFSIVGSFMHMHGAQCSIGLFKLFHGVRYNTSHGSHPSRKHNQ